MFTTIIKRLTAKAQQDFEKSDFFRPVSIRLLNTRKVLRDIEFFD